MTSRWAAVETDPLRRARQLQRSWERLLADGALGAELPPEATGGVRPTIVESWRRSLATGLDPTDLLAPIEADESEVLERWLEHPLGSLPHILTEQLRTLAEEARGMVVMTDASGLVLHRVGDEWLKERAAEMNLVEGARYDEAADGTNGIGTALAADHAFQVFAFEHFNDRHHQWVCSGAPVHDPVSGQTIGLIDLSSLWKIAHPRSLELVATAARTIEQRLVEARRDRDARLRRRYSDFMTRSTDLLVDHDGYVLDGAEPAHPSPLDIPEGGGEVVLGNGSVAEAAPLGRGEAYLLRQSTTRHPGSAPAVKGLERAEEHARKLAGEQAALRRVATLVAHESSPDQLFAVVAEQVARIIDVPHVRLVLYEPDGSFVVGGFSQGDHEPFPIGSRWPLDSPGVTATVRQTGRPARVEDYTDVTGEVAAVVRDAGMHSAVACPIVVERRLWGAMVVLSPRDEPLPEDTEARLTDFTELVATAIANARSREALATLADEQAALRRVATLVASGGGPERIFRAVADEVQALLGCSMSVILRLEDDGTATTLGTHSGLPTPGTRHPVDPDFIIGRVRSTRRAARFDTDDPNAATMPAIVRETGVRSAVASPIVVEGELWGAIGVGSLGRPLPPDTERRLVDFTELVATAVANTHAREEVRALADEQAALRRVAVLVAQQPSPSEVFTAVTQAVGLLLDADLAVMHVFPGDGTATTIASWSGDSGLILADRVTVSTLDGDSLAARIFASGGPARIDSYAELEGEGADLARSLGLHSAVGAPILVEGKLWGALMAATRGAEPWAENAETRIAAFTELAATAVANAESHEALAELADEQAALRRVATLVANGAQPEEVFWAVSDEVGRLFGTGLAAVLRYEPDGRTLELVGGTRTHERRELADFLASPEVLRAGRSARTDPASWDSDEGATAESLRNTGVVSTVASPIVVEGDLWGAMLVASTDAPLPVETEERLEKFTEIVATAIANAESREARAVLTEEQAGLRRVATLVARGVSPQDLFQAVAEEVGRLLPVGSATMGRFEPDDSVTTMASWSSTEVAFPTGMRWPTEGTNVAWVVLQTTKAARIDDFSAATDPIGVAAREAGYTSAVGSPIVVEGDLWGVISATSTEGPLPPDTEARLASFTELVATAIANAESREALAALADEQAALRRVATLVARGVQPARIFSAVSDEVGRLLGSDQAAVTRFDPEGPAIVVVGVAQRIEQVVTVGTRWELHDSIASAHVFRTGRSARVDRPDGSFATGPAAETINRLDLQSTVASPIVVEGRLWGTVTVSSTGKPLPADTEQRLEKFTELLATAIANADSRSELAASRRRIVAAADEARRRIERDLHDGIQQRLIALSFRARAMSRRPADELPGMAAELSAGLKDASDELREISHGIHPTILTEAGLGPALRALARRSDVPIDADVRLVDERLPPPVEAAAYYIASEALTNVAKHSQANVVELTAALDDAMLTLEIRDDGIGGVDAGRGSGLLGLTDRAEALGGTISIASPPGAGTRLTVRLPITA